MMRFLRSIIRSNPQPDFYFAAKGYVQVAITKREGGDEAYLRRIERAHAIELLKDGCSEGQALSARWGGCLAIEDDMILFEAAIRQGKIEAETAGDLPNGNVEAGKEVYRTIYQRAGDFAVRCAWEADRTMYGRFLKHIGMV